MKLATRHFGEIEYDPDMEIDFDEGMPGFFDMKKYVLVANEDDDPFCWLQSIDDPDLAFIMIRIYDLLPNYDPIVDVEEIESLGGVEGAELLIYNIVVIPDDIKQMRVNLKAPVVINPKAKKGKQVVLNNDDYSIRYYIYEDINLMGNR